MSLLRDWLWDRHLLDFLSGAKWDRHLFVFYVKVYLVFFVGSFCGLMIAHLFFGWQP